jgi:ATP-dependent Lon protease
LTRQKTKYWAELSNLTIKDANISEELLSQHEKMMMGGIWAIIDVDYDSTQMIGNKIYPFVVTKVRAIQLSNFDDSRIREAKTTVYQR